MSDEIRIQEWGEDGPGDRKEALRQERQKRQALQKENEALRSKLDRIKAILDEP